MPNIPDNDPARSGPRGIAVRFHLDEHLHTDIVAHSYDGFPVRTGEEFLEFLRAAAAFGSGRPEVMGGFLAAHPNAKRFVETPKPIPTSFAREAFFAGTAFQFTNSSGVSRYGRFRIRPDAGTEYLSNEAAAGMSPNFLFEEMGPHLAKQPVKLSIFVQMAEPADDIADASTTWPASRTEILFGKVTLTGLVDAQAPERRKIIFDPVPRVDGMEPSGDPLTQVRADTLPAQRPQAAGGHRRRTEKGLTRQV